MGRYEDEEDMFFESIGRVRRRGDDSRSPPPSGKRERSLTSEHRTVLSSEGQPERQSSHDNRNGHAQIKADDAQAAGALLPPRRHDQQGAESDHIPSKRENLLKPYDEQPEQSDSNGVDRGRSLRVKEPTENEDLTEAEFERYQARYGLRHKTSASQILQGTSDEDAEDPTLGNQRTQIRLSEDGTIDRRDFDYRGAFRYDSRVSEERVKMPERGG